MTLGDNEILQISATVIAGALIFVSFVGIKDLPPLTKTSILAMIILMIEPFALAAILTLSNKSKRGVDLLRLGFALIMILTAAIGGLLIVHTPVTAQPSPDT